jgi:hypothetical protein
LTTENPSNPGIWMSRNTRSGFSVLILRIASRPFEQVSMISTSGNFLEPQLQPLDGQLLVVDEDGADGHAKIPYRA